jgi:homogentisate 1,2-dioxygenase
MPLFGFGNHHQSEALPGALPLEQNSPQHCPLDLYAEQLSGSAFTTPRHLNLRSWLYRKYPSVISQDYQPYSKQITENFAELQSPTPLRWSPQNTPENAYDFIDSLCHMAGNNVAHTYLYHCNQSMVSRYFNNHDGELLFVPYLGEIRLATEFGNLLIKPGMIAVIPRGISFKVELIEKEAAGYICENLASPLKLPQLGPIGANGLANPRHFQYPDAAFEESQGEATLLCKFQNRWWITTISQTPLNVVAWHGNYAPYSYNLALFNTINTVSFDHPDPSIFTVLTSESNTTGVANLDFVIFPPRWMVAEHSFRPPYFHRNFMNELMGLVCGKYDAKQEGFSPGGLSIHNCMTAHGPDKMAYEKAIKDQLKPEKYKDTLAFMFESYKPWLVTNSALAHFNRQKDYSACWQGFEPK